ncbi:hypothetical protein BC831DRAFT_456228, partial [Entophlyctis helioformis]
MSTSRTSTTSISPQRRPDADSGLTQTPASEQPLLDRLVRIRSQLLATTAATSKDQPIDDAAVVALAKTWGEAAQIVKALSALRSSSDDSDVVKETESGLHIDTEVDLLLDDIVPLFFQLWSQAGKVPERMYPTYVQLAKISHTLNQLFRSGLFTSETVRKQRQRLSVIGDTINEFVLLDTAECYKQGEGMLKLKFKGCGAMIDKMQDELDTISPALHPIHDRLVEIKEELEALIARKNPHSFSLAEVQILQEELREIDSARIDGKYIAKDGSIVSGQAIVIQLLEASFDDVHELLASREAVSGDNPLRSIYEDLIRIKAKLERLLLQRLGEIDNMREDGKFMDEHGTVPPGQAVLHFLLHKCYRHVYKLQTACEPVADSLMPTYNQLITLQKCLNELKRWRVELSPRELIPYQMKLSNIDSERKDGKFLDEDGEVPEGQGTLHDLLNDCYEILHELQEDAQE